MVGAEGGEVIGTFQESCLGPAIRLLKFRGSTRDGGVLTYGMASDRKLGVTSYVALEQDLWTGGLIPMKTTCRIFNELRDFHIVVFLAHTLVSHP